MKIKLICVLASAIILAGCKAQDTTATATAQAATTTASAEEIPYVVANRYFVRNDIDRLPANKITSQEQFDSLFGMATVMGADGRPTPIDFDKEYVIAIDEPDTDIKTEITPVSLTFVPADSADGGAKDVPANASGKIVPGTKLVLTYKVSHGERRSYTTHPLLMLVVDRRYNIPLELRRI